MNCELRATCDVLKERAQRFAQEFQKQTGIRVETYDDFRQMLSQEGLDAVDICTDHRSHHQLAIACLEGKVDNYQRELDEKLDI